MLAAKILIFVFRHSVLSLSPSLSLSPPLSLSLSLTHSFIHSKVYFSLIRIKYDFNINYLLLILL